MTKFIDETTGREWDLDVDVPSEKEISIHGEHFIVVTRTGHQHQPTKTGGHVVHIRPIKPTS